MNEPYRFTTEQMRAMGNLDPTTSMGLELVHQDAEKGVRVWFDDGSQNGHPWLHTGYIEHLIDGQWVEVETFNADNPADYKEVI